MGKVIAGMSVSLDGYINDHTGSVEKLYSDFSELKEAFSFQEMIKNTGAAVMGRLTYEMADPFLWANETYEFQTPIFVLTHTPPAKYPKGNGKLSFIFVTDGIESAISQARKSAGKKDVQVVGGASTFQQVLNAGLCDEIGLDIISVLIGKGQKMFEHIDPSVFDREAQTESADGEKIKLERIKVEATTKIRTSLTFRVVK
jgi:dihydrofolate reductase